MVITNADGSGSCEVTRDRSGKRWLVTWFDEFGRVWRERTFDYRDQAMFAARFEF